MKDRSQYPIHLNCDSDYSKMHVFAYLNKDGDKICLNINGVNFEDLLYIFNPNDEQNG